MFAKQYKFIHEKVSKIEWTSYYPDINKTYNDRFWNNFINNAANFGHVWMDSAKVYAIILRPSNIFLCGNDGEPAIRNMCTSDFIKRRFVFDPDFKSIRPELINHPKRKHFLKKDKNHPLYDQLRDDINMMVRRSQIYLITNDKFQCMLMLQSALCNIRTLVYATKLEKYKDLERVYRRLATVNICLEKIGDSILWIKQYGRIRQKLTKYEPFDGYCSKKRERRRVMFNSWKVEADRLFADRFNERYTYNWAHDILIYHVNSDSRDILIRGKSKIIQFLENPKLKQFIVSKIKNQRCGLLACNTFYVDAKFNKYAHGLNKACKKCHGIYYCCKLHQKIHWKTHKPQCNKFNIEE